jgi:hypothetical protein
MKNTPAPKSCGLFTRSIFFPIRELTVRREPIFQFADCLLFAILRRAKSAHIVNWSAKGKRGGDDACAGVPWTMLSVGEPSLPCCQPVDVIHFV